jgi:death-on-curing protein
VTPRFLDYATVVEIHRRQIEKYGGATGINEGMLRSALGEPMAGVSGRYFHSDVFTMAAAYFFHIISNHAFVDGNKRTGVIASLTFLGLNGHPIRKPSDRLYELAMDVACGKRTVGKDTIARELRALARRAMPKPTKHRPKRRPSRPGR